MPRNFTDEERKKGQEARIEKREKERQKRVARALEVRDERRSQAGEEVLGEEDMKIATVPDDQVKGMQTRIKKTLDIFHDIADSISFEEIAEMKPDRKIAALRDLNVILTSAKVTSPRSVVLQNFNFKEATDPREIEKVLNLAVEEQQDNA